MGETELKLPPFIIKDGNFYLKTDRYLTNSELKIICANYRKRTVSFLSKREKQYLKLLCDDLKTSEIADILRVSPRTVGGFRDKLLEKTKSKSRVGLVIYAIKNKIVEI